MNDMGANMGKTNGGSLLENLALPSTHPTLHIVMLGLDSAGKTTALYRLKFDQYVNTVRLPTLWRVPLGRSRDICPPSQMARTQTRIHLSTCFLFRF